MSRSRGLSSREIRAELDFLYRFYNHRKYVHPDPLEFLYNYPQRKDREVAALIASSLAYGRVRLIVANVGKILDTLGPTPHFFLEETDPAAIRRMLRGFKYRFTTAGQMAGLLCGIRKIIREHGSLYAFFLEAFNSARSTADRPRLLGALSRFADALCEGKYNSLVPDPGKNSACKRFHLFLKWIVRRDRVDPGGWEAIPPSELIVPLDTHMYRTGRIMGFTTRKQADLKAALDITDGYRKIEPQYPVKFDFAVTRLGIRRGMKDHELEKSRLFQLAYAKDV